MPIKILPEIAVALFAIVFPLFASDITGEWRAEINLPNADPLATTFEFRVEGNKLTGAMLESETEEPILDGKVKDGQVTFKIHDKVKRTTFTYKGRIMGDTIRFRVVATSGRFRIVEFTAERAGGASVPTDSSGEVQDDTNAR